MGVDAELSVGGEALERLTLEHAAGVRREPVEDAPLEDEEAARYEPGAFRLLGEAPHGRALADELAEARRGPHAGHGRGPAVRAVEREQLVEVDVGEPVAVRAEKEIGVAERVLDALHTGAGHRVLTGVDQGDLPVLGLAVPDLEPA